MVFDFQGLGSTEEVLPSEQKVEAEDKYSKLANKIRKHHQENDLKGETNPFKGIKFTEEERTTLAECGIV